ncbi:hypothetical protein ACFWBI_12625 [Streptomyces sp. NPDC059982]
MNAGTEDAYEFVRQGPLAPVGRTQYDGDLAGDQPPGRGEGVLDVGGCQ